MVAALDLLARQLTFGEPDTATFRCLALAREAGERAAQAAAGGRPIAAPIVLNAANEVAVHAFLAGTVGFLEIEAVVEAALGALGDAAVNSLDDVFAADAEARGFADSFARQSSRS
jgi:1-deoxy-D-xylulose-5-phosphate reductoisomerase